MTTVEVNRVTLGTEHFGDAAAPLVLCVGGPDHAVLAGRMCAALAYGGRHVVRYARRDSRSR